MTHALPPAPPPSPNAAIADAYRELRPLLQRLAARRFRIPPGEVERLLHDVFLSFAKNFASVRDPRSWLVGAMSNECRDYWRAQGRTVPLPPECEQWIDPTSINLVDRLHLRFLVEGLLAHMDARCRRLLQLRFFDGCTVPEVADALAMKYRYTKKRLYLCINQFRALYLAKIGDPP